VTQTDDYSFNKGVKLGGKTNLSKAVIHGTLPDGRGSISMTFHPTGKASGAKGGCGGTPGKKRPGKFSGHLTLKADNLGKVSLTSVKATLSTATSLCNPRVPKGYFLEGFAGTTTPTYYVSAGKKTSTGAARETISVTRSGEPLNGGGYAWTFGYTYEAANEPTSDYTVTGISGATVTGASGISGTAKYTATKTTSHHHSNGHLTGSLSVSMATIGKVSPFAKHPKMQADQRHS
jgi:hypothetical protein